mgnify:CR=1 FL=1
MGVVKKISPDDYISMPWKNGLGMTTELAKGCNDLTSDENAFLWRLSIAGVSEDGPFSNFPNIDRSLMLIEGNGITLDGGAQGVGVLFEQLQVYDFPGDIELKGKLANGPIMDFNLMGDRRHATGELSGFNVSGPERLMLKSHINFIHLLEGSPPVTLDIEGELTVLESGHSLKCSNMNTGATIMPSNNGIGQSAIIFASINLIE